MPIADLTIQNAGARLRATASGSGDTVVMLHAGVADRRMWREVLAHFSNTHHVVAYDRRGFGETQTPDEPFRHIDDLGAVIGHFGAERPILIGCSQGGRIAIDYALAHPGDVAGLVLVAPAVTGAPEPDDYPPPVAELLAQLEIAEANGDIERVNALEARLWLDGPLCGEGRVAGDVRALFLDMNGRALGHAELTRQEPCPPAMDRLDSIAVPTLLMCGALDFAHIQVRSRRIAATIPGAQFRLMPGCAHLPNLEQPVEFNRAVREFLDRRSTGPGR